MLTEAFQIAKKLTEVFDQLSIAYFIGGSFASTIHGLPRATRDVDFIADIRAEQVDSFVAALEAEFYLDAKTIRSAITHQRSFNLIHFDTMFKADRREPVGAESTSAQRVETNFFGRRLFCCLDLHCRRYCPAKVALV